MSLLAKHASSPDAAPVAGDLAPPLDVAGTVSSDESPASLAITEAEIPTVVSAAWELELIIAGAVTFALFQLPGSLDSIRVALEPKAIGGALYALIIVFFYAKVVVYALLAAFVLNLTARAYWVGLVGLHSVYPRGIDWDRVRMGPAMTETYRERLASLPAIIARVDNFASVIFSFAFLVVVSCVLALVGSGLIGGLAWLVSTALFGGQNGLAIFEALAVVGALSLAVVPLVDKRMGARYSADTVAGRRLRRFARVVARINGTALFGPIFFTLFSNIRRGVMVSIFYGTFLTALFLVMAQFFGELNIIATSSPRYVPDDDEVRGVDADYYESMRKEGASSRVPTIQSDVVDGAYVRLFIPYIAERDDAAVATGCPSAAPLRPAHLHFTKAASEDTAATGRAADAVLSCLTRLHAVTVDGAPLSNLRLRFYRHPVTGREGMIGYLPTASLASGAHTITIRKAPREPGPNAARPQAPWEISFWK